MTKHMLRPLFFIAFVLVNLGFAGIAQSQNGTEATARRQFLVNLGFEDASAIIRAKLDRKEYLTELNRRQMIANAVAYEVLNAARELSILILEETSSRGFDLRGEPAAELARFTAKMLALKPLSPPTDYPARIMQLTEGEERDRALLGWLHEERTRQMNQHKARLVSDIASLIGVRDVNAATVKLQRIDRLLTTIVDRMYLDDTIGNGKYLGRALAALLVREEKVRGGSEDPLSRIMQTELRTYDNMRLENFIGDTLIIPDAKGDKRYKVENGTMMLSRNLAPGSLQISWAAIPERLSDRWKARAKGMIGNPLAAPLYVTPEDTAEGLTLSMRIRDRIAEGGYMRMGYSHIVYYEVKEDPATGIKMTRVIDNYPNRVFDSTNEYVRTGGTRLTYPEQVIDFSHHSAVYFSSPVAEKTREWAKQAYGESGYQPEFFPSIEVDLKDGVIPQKNERVANWKTKISRSDYETLNAEKSATKFSREVWSRYVKGLEQTVYDGVVFHWPDPYDFYLIGATYCSQLGDMVMRQYVGMPLEQTKSQWHWLVRFLSHVGHVGEELKRNPLTRAAGEKLLALPNVDKSMKMAEIPIIAPSTLALQPFMKGEAFRFASRTPEQRIQSSYLIDDYREADPTLTRAIEQSVSLVRFEDRRVNGILDAGAAMRDLEYGMVIRASRGMKTQGFSPERFAEMAVAKEVPRLKAAEEARRAAGARCEAAFR